MHVYYMLFKAVAYVLTHSQVQQNQSDMESDEELQQRIERRMAAIG